MDTAGRVAFHQRKNQSSLICIDKIGEGAGVYSRLKEMYDNYKDITVYGFDSRIKADDKETYYNKKAEAWWNASKDYFFEKRVGIPNDQKLISQLSGVTYEFKSGRIKILDKEKLKVKLGGSPDRADCLVMGLDALKIAEKILVKENKKARIKRENILFNTQKRGF